jgi:hypothetical protein
MSTKKISIDAGNGAVKAVMAQTNGRYKSVIFPAVRGTTNDDTLGIDNELKIDTVYWGDRTYVVGDDIFKTRKAIETHQGDDRYGNEFVAFLVAVAIAKLGLKKADVELTLFAPPKLYPTARVAIDRYFSNTLKNKMIVKFKGDKSNRVFNIKKLSVVPEGIGAAATLALDKNGKVTDGAALTGRILVMDIGMYTLDVPVMIDGEFDTESLATGTLPEQGIQAHILNPLLVMVQRASNEFSRMTISDIDRCLRHGMETGDFALTAGIQSIDLKKPFDTARRRYADWLANTVISSRFSQLIDYRGVLLVGGGDTYVREFIEDYYTREKIIALPVDSLFANAIGGLRLALAG